MHPGNGPGLSSRRLGEKSGSETHTITTTQMPSHNHPMNMASTNEGDQTNPAGNIMAVSDDRNYVNDNAGSTMGPTGDTGGGQAINHVSPFTTVNFIIALVGIFPSRN